MESKSPDTAGPTREISAANARLMARLFNLGNILAFMPGLVVAPFLFIAEPEKTMMIFMFLLMVVPPILWFGISIMVYIVARHHPNPRVGHYTQTAAYRFYGALGVIIPVGTFFGTDWKLWIVTGGLVALVVVPWSAWELWRINHEDWQDTTYEVEHS